MFRNPAAEFVYVRTYAHWLEDKMRREVWPESVDRYVHYIKEKKGDNVPDKVMRKIRNHMINFSVMPSMRFLWAAGKAADQDNATIYNCSFVAVDYVDVFAESLYVLMCGAGLGFSVENEHVSKLPHVPQTILPSDRTHIIEDSKAGWADSIKILANSLYTGQDINFDYNLIRKAGERLKTMGGRASGPGPLAQLHHFIRSAFNSARGRKLTSLECHDIMNEIAQIVVVGGVRRSSEISLSDLDDVAMRGAKAGSFPVRRYMANNSAVYGKKPDVATFIKEWASLIESRSGERGIFNLEAARYMAPKRRDASLIQGTNPCGEILLRSKQFCNLSEAVARAEDTIEDLLDKVETATWMGVIQSCFTYFPYLSEGWAKNCEEERLLGVSITGQADAPHLFSPEALRAYKTKVLRTAKKAADILGIPMPTATTCVKPSGSVGQVVDSSPGMHRRIFRHGIRRYRISATDPLFKMIKDQGVPVSPENGQRKQDYVKALKIYEAEEDKAEGMRKAKTVCPLFDNDGWSFGKVNTWVASFPSKAPDGAVVAEDSTAIEQLEYYKRIQTNWCEHNASITIYIKTHEWLEVGDWVYKNWSIINGISFLPYEDTSYEQMPWEKLTKEEYDEMAKKFPKIDYSQLHLYEKEDATEGAKVLACGAGGCDI